MTLKIELIEGRIRLSGEFRSEHLDQVKAEIDRRGSPVVLDLEELSSVDVDGIRFLNTCEAKGISVSHCSPYIKVWMSAEAETAGGANTKEEKGPLTMKTKTNAALVKQSLTGRIVLERRKPDAAARASIRFSRLWRALFAKGFRALALINY